MKEGLLVAFMNQDLLFLEFDILEEVKRVFEIGRRWLRVGFVKLE